MEYYLSLKEKKFLSFSRAWINMENIILNEIRQAEKDKQALDNLFVEYFFLSQTHRNGQYKSVCQSGG